MPKSLLILSGFLSVIWLNTAFPNLTSTAILLEIKGSIGPPSVSFIEKAPNHIVEQEKNTYNKLKIDIDKINFTIKSLK